MESSQTLPDVPCDGCAIACAQAAATGDTVICTCGSLHLAPGLDDLRLPRATPSPSVVRTIPGRTEREPRVSARRFERQHEDATTTGVRRLLCELRPDASGPFGWGPEASPPDRDEDPLGAMAKRIRVQCSVIVPAIIPTAFASAAGTTRGVLIARLLEREASRLEDLLTMSADAYARATGRTVETRAPLAVRLRGVRSLAWLQRNGSLRSGADALYAALAMSIAEKAHRARWESASAGAWRGAVVWGAARCDEAAQVWDALSTAGTSVDTRRDS